MAGGWKDGRVEGWVEGDEMGMAYLCHSFSDIDDSDSASVFSQVTHELDIRFIRKRRPCSCECKELQNALAWS